MASLRVPGAVSIGRSRLAGQHPVDEGGGEPGIGLGRQQSVEGGVEAVVDLGRVEEHVAEGPAAVEQPWPAPLNRIQIFS